MVATGESTHDTARRQPRWHPVIARSRAPLEQYVHQLLHQAPVGQYLVLARSHDACLRLRRMLPAPTHVMTMADAFGLLGPGGIDREDLMSPLVTHWAVLDSLPVATKGPMRAHLAREVTRAIALLESHGLVPPYPADIAGRLDPVLAGAHQEVTRRRAAQHALGRYDADERVLLLARALTEGHDPRQRMASRFPSVRKVVLAEVAWLSPAERAALDALASTVDEIHVTLVARPASATDTEWAALAHTDAFRTYLGERGAIRDLEGGDARAGALVSLATAEPLERPPLPGVSVRRPIDAAQETREVAAQVAALVADGVQPHSIAVVAPDLEGYAARLREALERHGLPISLRHHGHTAHTPAGSLLAILLLDALDKGLDRDAVLEWMGHPLCTLRGDSTEASSSVRLDAGRLRERLQERGLRPRGASGPRGWYASLDALAQPGPNAIRRAEHKGEAPRPVSDWDLAQTYIARSFIGSLDDLASARDANRFVTQLRGLLAQVQLPQNVLRHARSLPDPDVLLAGYRQLVSLIDDVERAYETSPPQDIANGAQIIRDALRHALRTLELPLSGDPDYGVQIIGWRNAAGLPVRHVFVVGATDRTLPTRGASARTARRLAAQLGPNFRFVRIDEDREARWVLHRILTDTAEGVHFSAPQRDADGPIGASVLLDELVDGFVLDDPPEVPTALRTWFEVHRAVALGAMAAADEPRLVAQQALVGERGGSGAPGPYSGAVLPETMEAHPDAAPLMGAQALAAGRIERFARCAYRSLILDAFKMGRPEVRDGALTPLDRGNLLHDVLDAYARDGLVRKGSPFHPSVEDLDEHAHLFRIGADLVIRRAAAHPAWEALAITLLGGLEVPQNPHRRAPPGLLFRVLEEISEMASGDGILATELDFGGDEGNGLEFDVHGRKIRLRGQIDRIDHRQASGSAGRPGLRVIDYKGGEAPLKDDTLGGIDFQLPIYLHAASTLFPDHHPREAAYYALKSPRKDDYGIKQTRYNSSQLSRADDPERFDQLITKDTPDRIERMITAERAGRFGITWLDPEDAGCSYCDVRRMCGMNVERHMERRLATRTLDDHAAQHTGYIPPLARQVTDEEEADEEAAA